MFLTSLKLSARQCAGLVLGIFFSVGASAQKKNEAYQLHIFPATSAITIDGESPEQAWADAETAKDFYMILPMDTSQANVQTEVKMAYNKNNLFLLAICYKKGSKTYFVESLRRDFSFGKNDNFLFFIDPFNDQTNGFSFGANAAGAQWDGTMYNGGNVDLNWDNKWVSAVKNYDDRWVLEMAIPFSSIRFKEGITSWGINFSRNDLPNSEKSAWAPVPRQFPSASLAYTGSLVWDAPPPAPKANISMIPFLLTGISKNHEAGSNSQWKRDAGMDAKIALGSSLNLDLTVNPDFSQVELDQQITNLDRFELFYPEKRQFFLENGDLFGNFGYSTLRPFFSRRIGLVAPINFGARVSGKLNKNWRIGAMDMQTASVGKTALPAQNFVVASIQRKVFSRSNISFIFVNKQSVNYHPEKDSVFPVPVYSQYNRNVGVEYNLASSNNFWTGKLMFLKSFTPGVKTDDWVQAGHIQYTTRSWNLLWQQEIVGKNYNAEVGYVPRNGYIKLNPQAAHNFFPKRKGAVLLHGPRFSYTVYNDQRLKRTDDEAFLGYVLNFRNQSMLDAWVAHNYVILQQPFDPTNYTKDTLTRGSIHRWSAWGTDYISKPKSVFTWSLSTRFGGYFQNGKRQNVTASVGYRFQPYVSLSVNASYNRIELPAPWNLNTFWLVGPKFDFTFTNKIYFTTFIQYNEQQDNLNVNARFQWRYKPASDLFIVYTDNYYPSPFLVRNRALLLKLTYWWNTKVGKKADKLIP